eukprot:TRINITY_DN2592_c0_g1_i2.p1 TRINITY_DN2592_c0_g1~~TRINITY_DN2592_c0_g1_i2.p1  ORF type:complete len:503 (+),score=138.62 TRINITY_DN2592_c0_g1_i2:85-1593(+)
MCIRDRYQRRVRGGHAHAHGPACAAVSVMPSSEDEKREVATSSPERADEADGSASGPPQMHEDVPNYLDQFDVLEGDFQEEEEPAEEEEVDSDVEDIFAQIEGGWDQQGWSGEKEDAASPPAQLFGNVGSPEEPSGLKDPPTKELPESDADPYEDAMKLLSATERDSNEIIKLLLRPGLDILEGVSAVLKKPKIREFVQHVIDLHEACNRCHLTVELCIQKDLEAVTDPATILRSESLYCRMSAQYVGHLTKTYIPELLSPVLPGVLELEVEIDENKLDDSLSEEIKASILQTNMSNMQEALASLLTAFEASEEHVPLKARYVMHAAHTAVAAKFPGQETPSSGSLLFLRNICPALTSPSASGIELTVDRSARRKLILVTKLVQTMANGIILPVDNPDRSDGKLNQFVNEQTPRVQQLISQLAGSEVDLEGAWVIPEEVGEVAEPLVEFLLANLDLPEEHPNQTDGTQEVVTAVKSLSAKRTPPEEPAVETEKRNDGCCMIL